MGSVVCYVCYSTLAQRGLVSLNLGGGGWGVVGCLIQGVGGTKIYLSLLFYEPVTEKTKNLACSQSTMRDF